MRALALTLTLISFCQSATAQSFFGGGSYSKRGNSENTRWTLADWISQKKQFSLMDQWLAMNKQVNFFEFNIEGGQSSYDLNVGGTVTKQKVTTISAQAWVSIFGLQYTQAKSDEDWESKSYQLNVRLFGQSSQATSLTAYYGRRAWEDTASSNTYDNNFAGAKLTLYVVDFFGIDGGYRKDFSATDSTGRELEATRAEYGIFFDLNFIRLYGTAFKDTTTVTQSGASTEQSRDGLDAGVKFYF